MTYDKFKALGLTIDMTRGKPSAAQLEISTQGLTSTNAECSWLSRDGIDCRNYGYPLGLPEMREFGAELLGTTAANVVAAGNASLELMHDTIVYSLLHGTSAGVKWGEQEEVAFLCPVPGYDRHFAICAALGIRMIPVPLCGDGPDMDLVEDLVAKDPKIKGMWCMPMYSNPTGEVYSKQVVERLAAMKTAASDFRLFWDDAYRVHHLAKENLAIPFDILELCAKAGTPNRPLIFASLSKVTWAGSAVSFLAASKENVGWYQRCSSARTIGPDKANQLRHVRYLPNLSALTELMNQHRLLLAPKFDTVTQTFGEMLSDVPGVSWTTPRGGYFISLYSPDGLAKRTIQLAAGAGVAMTPAGSAFPHGLDTRDYHMRIAPSFPSIDEVRLAATGIALALRRAVEERG